jgi:hypothetical protein
MMSKKKLIIKKHKTLRKAMLIAIIFGILFFAIPYLAIYFCDSIAIKLDCYTIKYGEACRYSFAFQFVYVLHALLLDAGAAIVCAAHFIAGCKDEN